MKSTDKKVKLARRHAKIRTRVSGTGARPRLCVNKSNTTLSAQLIDDEKAVTLAAVSTKGADGATLGERAEKAGAAIAAAAKGKSVSTVVFDRGGYKYTGNVKRFADAARAGGLEF